VCGAAFIASINLLAGSASSARPPTRVAQEPAILPGAPRFDPRTCASLVATRPPVASSIVPQESLLAYRFAAAPAPTDRRSNSDVILSVDSLQDISFELDTAAAARGDAKVDDRPAGRPAPLACDLLETSAHLLRLGNGQALKQAVSGFGWVTAGRYSIAADLYAAANENEAANSIEVLAQLGLGRPDFDLLLDRLASGADKPLVTKKIVIRFRASGGTFQYNRGMMDIDPLGLQRLIVADFLQHQADFVDLPTCLTRQWPRPGDRIFCSNVLTRIKLYDGRDAAILAPGATAPPGHAPVAAGTFADWRQRYGLTALEAYIDEAWNYVRAGATATDGPQRESSSPVPAESSELTDRFVYGERPAGNLKKQFTLILAHELSHHLLGHDLAAATPGGQALDPCLARLGLEAQADVFGGLLYRLAGAEAGDAADGQTGRPAAGQPDAPPANAYATWSPYFDGYVGLFENREARCGYLSGQARHVLSHVVLTGQDWIND
jgi:hypothetical protein